MKQEFIELKDNIEFLKGFHLEWFVCGGWAIDLFINRETRSHQDIEIGILREFQLELQSYFVNAGWKLFWIKEGQEYPWLKGQSLVLPIHQLCAKKDGRKLEILLSEANAGNWIYRRNFLVTLPLENLTEFSEIGIRFLTPEVALLYKSKNTQVKDEKDFELTLPLLTRTQKNWLKEALNKTSPEHPWLLKFQ